ncbi:universal stress protein [Salicibibacter cibi]|uniref:Universal stress protein n=1 Tax=Salicibibacter cibi TaxID=2743001 RepID=A0A7T6Z942_9BACI|nr:universal stress protein [Salicibibacter cibi]QQK79090.1 universal stress protein [Salicibibacter cibi]
MYKKILVAVDGSVQSEQALDKAIQLAKLHGASLTIAHVVDIRNFYTQDYTPQSLYDETEKKAEQMLKEYKEKAGDEGLKDVETLLRSGNPRNQLTGKLLTENDVDLLVTGSTGRNAFERMLIGSVAEACVRHASCDVVTVRSALT